MTTDTHPRAQFSTDADGPDGRGRYRYTLFRKWDMQHDLVASQGGTGFDRAGERLMVIGLNPSTADETNDDPTIRRCIDFAMRWGFGGLVMLNLFALRATDPRVMKVHPDPEGDPMNAKMLTKHAAEAGMILCAWGNHGAHRGRRDKVCALLTPFGGKTVYLRMTKKNQPEHPLYIPADTMPLPMFMPPVQ